MKLYLDSANLSEIEELANYGIIDGITTNPSLIKEGAGQLSNFISSICTHIKTSVSVEVIATDFDGMLSQGYKLANLAPQVTVKLPMTWEGLRVCKILSQEGIKTNITLCFNVTQALLAAKAGATYVSPFIGRLEDDGQDGLGLIKNIKNTFSNYSDFNTKILAASIRNLKHLQELAIIGTHVATAPYLVIKQMVNHPLTEIGLKNFLISASQSGYNI